MKMAEVMTDERAEGREPGEQKLGLGARWQSSAGHSANI